MSIAWNLCRSSHADYHTKLIIWEEIRTDPHPDDPKSFLFSNFFQWSVSLCELGSKSKKGLLFILEITTFILWVRFYIPVLCCFFILYPSSFWWLLQNFLVFRSSSLFCTDFPYCRRDIPIDSYVGSYS